jgi:hypothetical protein
VTRQHHIAFGDGCACQFKGSRTMYFLARYVGLTSSYKMNWHYFGTKHGKGEWDGAGVVVKRVLKAK